MDTKLEMVKQNLRIFPSIRFSQLVQLNCSYNELIELPPLPDTLKTLYCCSNQLKTFPKLPDLIRLSCAMNQLTSLDLPDSIEHVYCRSNQLVHLTIPPNVVVLYCGCNVLETLDLNEGLLELECSNNQLTHIQLTETLVTANLSYNPIDTLPLLPETLLTLNMRHTNIADCFYIPERLCHLYAYRTPLYDKVESVLKADMPVYDPVLLKEAFDTIKSIEQRFRYSYYCLKLKEKMINWLWRIRERIAIETYHPDRLMEWLAVHDYDSLDGW